MNNRITTEVMNNETVGNHVSDGLTEKQHTKVHYHGFAGYLVTMQIRRKQSHIYTDMDNLANRKSWVEVIRWEDNIKSYLRKAWYEGVQRTPLKRNYEFGIQTSKSLKFWEILNILDGSHPTVWDTVGSIKDMDVTLIGLYRVYSRACTSLIQDTSFYVIKQKYITRNTWSILL